VYSLETDAARIERYRTRAATAETDAVNAPLSQIRDLRNEIAMRWRGLADHLQREIEAGARPPVATVLLRCRGQRIHTEIKDWYASRRFA
jgi:hypothetical protein